MFVEITSVLLGLVIILENVVVVREFTIPVANSSRNGNVYRQRFPLAGKDRMDNGCIYVAIVTCILFQ